MAVALHYCTGCALQPQSCVRRFDFMHSEFYREYLQSKEWRKRRFAKLEEVAHRCQYCGESDQLSVHHLNYDHLGYEDTKELIVLCPSCHWFADDLRRNSNSKLSNSKLFKQLYKKNYKLSKKEKAKKERRARRKAARKQKRSTKPTNLLDQYIFLR